jgi:hypothetical protein
MTPRRVTYVIEELRSGQWWPVAAWWTREQAREDKKEREARPGCGRLRITDYRPLDGWGGTRLRYHHNNKEAR